MLGQVPVRPTMVTRPSRLAVGCLVIMTTWPWCSADDSSRSRSSASPPVAQSVILDVAALNESSGLVFSRRTADRVWTHNDSGGQARIYAFDTAGRPTGRADLAMVKAKDWEDIAALMDQGTPRLIVADSGDRPPRRESILLHLFDEPDPDTESTVRNIQTIVVRYPDGPRDCEAIAVDARRRRIYLATKTLGKAAIYAVPLPVRADRVQRDRSTDVLADRVASVAIPMVTGMDLDPVTGDLWVISYFRAYQFRSTSPDQSLPLIVKHKPSHYRLPGWKQIEAIAVERTGQIWITSEGTPAKMGRLAIAAPADEHQPGREYDD